MKEKDSIYTKAAAIATVLALALGGLFWLFQVSVAANDAKQAISTKANASDVTELKEDIKELQQKIDALTEDINSSVFTRRIKCK